MSVDVIVGGQGGDEGKGKIAAYLSLKENYDICMRVSGPNAGHTIEYGGGKIGLATLPCGYVNQNSRLLLGRGSFILVDRLMNEIEKTDCGKRLGIDRYATIITPFQKRKEKRDSNLMGKIGSVGTGLGPARIAKLKRPEKEENIKFKWEIVIFAKDIPELQEYLTDTTKEIMDALERNKKVLLEGDQGFKLSLIHGEYPYVTSRDTTASTFLGEAGIGPKSVKDVYIVFKPYVTRVAPGPLEKEITDELEIGWMHNLGGEVGTVSGRKRRAGEFEWENAKRAISINSATKIAITHYDYFYNIEDGQKKALDFWWGVTGYLGTTYPYPKISLISDGPGIQDIRIVRSKSSLNGTLG